MTPSRRIDADRFAAGHAGRWAHMSNTSGDSMAPEDIAKTGPHPAPTPGLAQLLRGSLVTQLIHVAATLGVADLLRDGPKSSHELGASLTVDPDALYRVLRALASLGIFEETEAHRFAL